MPEVKCWNIFKKEKVPLDNNVELYTCKELAKKLKVSYTTLQILRIKGGGPKFVKIGKGQGGKVLYDWKDVLVYLEAAKQTSTSDNGENHG